MDYKEKTLKKYFSFVTTSYGFKACFWGQLIPLIITIVCWISFFNLIPAFETNVANYIDLAKSVAFFIGGVIAICALCIGNMLFGLIFKDYADSIKKEK